MTQTRRIDALDGLRGVAALIVVVHHTLVVTPSLANILIGEAPQGTAAWIITYTPLRILWAGPEAVWVFFVLSGFVLVRPYLADRPLDAPRFYLRRFVRLYVPVFASFVFAASMRLVPRSPKPDSSWWIAGHIPAAGIKDSARTMMLVFGNKITLDLVWWSLQWEVWFAALLPVLVIVLRRRRDRGVLLLVVFGCVSAAGRIVADGAFGRSFHLLKAPWYLGMFGVGAGLALLEEPLRRRLSGTRTLVAVVFIVVAVSLLTLPGAIEALIPASGVGHGVGLFVSGGVGVVGAGACVVAALAVPSVAAALRRRPVHWLGTRSFSLYLTHDPIVAAIALGFGLSAATWWSVPLSVVVSVIVAAGFYRLVEAPTLALLGRFPAVKTVEPRRAEPA